MRDRSEILGDGLEAVKKETVLTQSDLRLTLLLVEVLVDIRDTLYASQPFTTEELEKILGSR